jgi:hypothetical protein
MSTSVTVDGVDPSALTPTRPEKPYTGAIAGAHQERSAALAKGMARLTSMFKIERAGVVLLLAAVVGAMVVTNGARAEQNNFKVKHGVSQAVKQSPATPHIRLARRTETLRPSGKLPFADKIRPRINAKIDCAAIGCKAKPPILKHQRKGLPCKIVGCKPGNGGHGGHHGNHHNHHKHGSWAWGGVTIVASDHGGCGYEFWKWKTTGWRYWRHAYLSCRDWE